MSSSINTVTIEEQSTDTNSIDAKDNNDTMNRKDAADEIVDNDNDDDKSRAPDTNDNDEQKNMEIDQEDGITTASVTQNIDKQNNNNTNSNKDIAKAGSSASAGSIVETMIYEETMRQIEYAWEAQRRIARRCVSKDEILRKMKS